MTGRDLWWEAREYTAEQAEIDPDLFERGISFAAAVEGSASDRLMMVDLNKYRANTNVELLIDQGVRLFGLRVIGPTQWIYANWKYEVDPTFVKYYERIRKYDSSVWILGYGVHNPWSNEEGNYLGIDPQVKLLKEATRNHICDLYCWDDEVGKCWKDGRDTTITSTNLVKSIRICMEQTLAEFEKWPNGLPKIPVHYSANWFMKTYAPAQYQAWLDQALKDPGNRPFLTWRAWLPKAINSEYPTISDVFDQFITPTGIQENAYLRMGSEPAADLWQGTFTAKVTGLGEASGVDASIGYGLSNTIDNFAYNANLPIGSDEPEPEPEPEPPTGDLAERVAALEARVDAIEQWIRGF